MPRISHKRLLSLVSFNQRTGVFTALQDRGSRVRKGKPCGSMNGPGYKRLMIDGKEYTTHRLAWFYVTRKWPTKEIDHKNGTRSDTRFKNLRDVARSINMQNRRNARKDSKSGLLGAYFHTPSKRWYSTIQVDGKRKYLGYFKTAKAAHVAYVAAKRAMHPGCTI